MSTPNDCVCVLTTGETRVDGNTSVTTVGAIAEANTLMIGIVNAVTTSGGIPTDPTTVTGWGLTWQKIDTMNLNNIFTIRNRTVAYVAKVGASDISGSFTASGFGLFPYRIYAVVLRIRNATIGTNALDSIVQFNHNPNTDGGVV